jgi:hypothetical protein
MDVHWHDARRAMSGEDCESRSVDEAAQLEDNHMPRLGAAHGLQGQASIEGQEPAAILDRQAQQINVRDLVGPKDVAVVEDRFVVMEMSSGQNAWSGWSSPVRNAAIASAEERACK